MRKRMLFAPFRSGQCVRLFHPPLASLLASVDNRVHTDLRVDEQSETHFPNQEARPVLSGHLVYVKPSPLPDPALVSVTEELAAELGLDEEACHSEAFVRLFSGDVEGAGAEQLKPWATPYAVSVVGRPVNNPDQFGGGYAYGDGRALSIGVFKKGDRTWELQLKGAGTTPFSRTFDGRAVLRSSVREFLVSEAMHSLGIPTTRALSLTVSKSEYVYRAWYEPNKDDTTNSSNNNNSSSSSSSDSDDSNDGNKCNKCDNDAPPLEEEPRHHPDVAVRERCAVLCRAAPSFLRVGHVELFGRRAWRDAKAKEELGMLLNHAIKREFPSINNSHTTDSPSSPSSPSLPPSDSSSSSSHTSQPSTLSLPSLSPHLPPSPNQLLEMLTLFAERQAVLVTHWMRVGYVQGNMNSDNCLLSGRTMDYGPFGFVDVYCPLWTPFTSDPQRNYGFENQPNAANTNLLSLAQSLVPLLPEKSEFIDKFSNVVYKKFPEILGKCMHDMHKAKLGLPDADENTVAELWAPLRELLKGIDFTIFWRQLVKYSADPSRQWTSETILQPLLPAMYPEFVSPVQKNLLEEWVRRYLEVAVAAGNHVERQQLMRRTSPKYVPREWMLIEAYRAAANGDLQPFNTLKNLFRNPYDEHPELEGRFYQLTPKHLRGRGGVSFYS